MINPQGFELPMSRINFYGPKDVRAIEVLLCLNQMTENQVYSMYTQLYGHKLEPVNELNQS